jgi:hypothetical protein
LFPGTEFVTDPETGGTKGSKPCQLQWAPPDAMRHLGNVLGLGATKYGPHNYRKGVDVGLYIGAAFRHIVAHQGGETYDPESGEPHLAHAACVVLMALQTLIDHGERFDDRYQVQEEVRAEVERAIADEELRIRARDFAARHQTGYQQ